MNERYDKRDEELRERAAIIVRKKQDLFINVVIYIIANLIFTFIWFITGKEFFWPIFCMLGWGFGLAAMVIDVIHCANNKGDNEKIEKEFQRLKRYSGQH